MANSKEILKQIEQIAASSGKNQKQDLVKLYANDSEFRKVIEYAYNPFKTYGVRQIPVREAFGTDGQFDEGTWGILDDLIFRSLSGSAARQAIENEMCRLDEESSDLFVRIIRKDMKAGFSESTCNKAVKGLIPEFPYMRCCLPKDAKLQDFDWTLGVISQEKADGMFINMNVEGGDDAIVSITSRQGTPFPMDEFGDMAAEARLRLAPGTQQHGELLVRRNGVICAREIGNGILNSIISGGEFEPGDEPVYVIWDQIPLAAVVPKGKYAVPYLKRVHAIKAQLKEAMSPLNSIVLIETRVVHSLEAAYDHYRDMLAVGKEGVVIKNPHAHWRDGTSKEQVKLKLEADVDLIITAVVPGKDGGKNEGRAGSLTCVTSCGALVVDVTVKNDAMRNSIDASNDDWIGKIIVVRANAVMTPSGSQPHSLFLPRMVEHGYRTDKTEADSLQQVRDQFEAAVKAA